MTFLSRRVNDKSHIQTESHFRSYPERVLPHLNIVPFKASDAKPPDCQMVLAISKGTIFA